MRQSPNVKKKLKMVVKSKSKERKRGKYPYNYEYTTKCSKKRSKSRSKPDNPLRTNRLSNEYFKCGNKNVKLSSEKDF